MPKAIVIGKLRYDIVSDTSSFVRGVRGSTKSAKMLQKMFKDSLSPLGAYKLKMSQLGKLLATGNLTQAQYTRLAEKANRTRWRAVAAENAESKAVDRGTRSNYAHASSIAAVNAARRGGGGGGGGGRFSKMPGNLGGAAGSLMGGHRVGAAGRLLGHGAAGLSSVGMVGMGAAAGGAALAAGTVGYIAKSAVEFGKFEKQVVDLQSIVGKGLGAEIVSEFRQIGRETVLTTSQLTRGAAKWASYGNSMDDVVGIMESIGTVTGGDAQKMQDLTVALAQVESTGRLMGQEKNQLINAGFSLKGIADAGGFGMDEFKQKMEAGEISSAMVLKGLKEMTKEGGIFGSRLEDNAGTLSGKWGIMTNEITEYFIQAGGLWKDELGTLLDMTTDLIKGATYWGGAFNSIGEGGMDDNWITSWKDSANAMWNGTSAELERQERITYALDEQAKALGFQSHAAQQLAIQEEKRLKIQEKIADTMTDQQKAQQMLDRAALDARAAATWDNKKVIEEILALEAKNRVARGGPENWFSADKALVKRYKDAQADSEAIEAKKEAAKLKREAKVDAIKEAGAVKIETVKEQGKVAAERVESFLEAMQKQASFKNPAIDPMSGGADYQYIQQRTQRRREEAIKHRLDAARNQKLEAIKKATENREKAISRQTDALIKAMGKPI